MPMYNAFSTQSFPSFVEPKNKNLMSIYLRYILLAVTTHKLDTSTKKCVRQQGSRRFDVEGYA